METSPLEMYLKVCPNARLNFFQMDLIEAEITDVEAWQETLMFWFGNNYRAESVFKMIEYYKGVINGRYRKDSKQPFGRRTDQDVIEASKEFYDNFS